MPDSTLLLSVFADSDVICASTHKNTNGSGRSRCQHICAHGTPALSNRWFGKTPAIAKSGRHDRNLGAQRAHKRRA